MARGAIPVLAVPVGLCEPPGTALQDKAATGAGLLVLWPSPEDHLPGQGLAPSSCPLFHLHTSSGSQPSPQGPRPSQLGHCGWRAPQPPREPGTSREGLRGLRFSPVSFPRRPSPWPPCTSRWGRPFKHHGFGSHSRLFSWPCRPPCWPAHLQIRWWLEARVLSRTRSCSKHQWTVAAPVALPLSCPRSQLWSLCSGGLGTASCPCPPVT